MVTLSLELTIRLTQRYQAMYLSLKPQWNLNENWLRGSELALTPWLWKQDDTQTFCVKIVYVAVVKGFRLSGTSSLSVRKQDI